jgi:hypothetical protein
MYEGEVMNMEICYRYEGYQKGLVDAKRTGGKINKRYVDNYLNDETQSLSIEDSSEFIKGWHEGFADAVRMALNMMVQKEGLVKSQIYEVGLN